MKGKGLLVVLLTNTLLSQVNSYNVKTLYTIGYYYSQYFSLEENMTPDGMVRFSVRAPRDAQILLAPTHDADEPVYEIVLGAENNTVNHIRGRCPCQEEPNASIRTVNLLNSQEFHNFWVRVKQERYKTYVQVGLGDNDKPFHEWRDPRPLSPQYLSFRSATRVEWRYGFKDANYKDGITEDRRQSIVTSTGFGQYFSLADVVNHLADGIVLYFTARTRKELQVLLSPTVSTLGDVYLIGINENGTYLKRRLLGENKSAFHQLNFVNANKRLHFWIKISTDGVIMFGKDELSNPLLQWRDSNSISVQYLSFSMRQNSAEEYDPMIFSDVQYSLGPDYVLNTQDCTPRWKASKGKLPPGAVRGGWYNQEDMFVCRAQHDSESVPGNYIVNEEKRGACYISYNFTVLHKSEFEVLTGCNMKWVPVSSGYIPQKPIVGGLRKGKVNYYIIRAKYENFLIIGKLRPEERIAYVPYNGQELPFTRYEVLVQAREVETARFITGTETPQLFLEEINRNTEYTSVL